MNFKRFYVTLCLCLVSLMFTGCGDTLYTMTADEETTVVLYAAKMVAKFNKNQTTGVCNARIRDGELDEAYGISSDSDENEEINDDISSDVSEVDPETGEEITSEGDLEGNADTGLSFTDAIGIEGMEFSCSSFDVVDEFQTEYFVLTRVSGEKYLVLYIDGTNTTDETIDFSELSTRSYKLSVGGSTSSTQNTFLDNDLSTFDGVIDASDSMEFILVFQFNSSELEDISSLSLLVDDNGQTRGTTIN